MNDDARNHEREDCHKFFVLFLVWIQDMYFSRNLLLLLLFHCFVILFCARFVTKWMCFENCPGCMRISFAAEIIWIGWYKEMLPWLIHYCSTFASVDLKHDSRSKIIITIITITENNSLLISYFCYVGSYINNVIQSWSLHACLMSELAHKARVYSR
jgi:hypothetical protein